MIRAILISLVAWIPMTLIAAESPDARRTNVTPQPVRSGPQESYFLNMPSGMILPHLEVELSLTEVFRGSTFVVIDPETNTFKRALLGPQQRTDIHLSLGLNDELELGLTMPIVHAQEGEYVGFGLGETNSGTGIADLNARVSWQHLNQKQSPIFLTSTLILTVPTGNDAAYTSRGELGMELRETVSRQFGPFLIGSSIGFHYQAERRLVDQEDGTRLRVGTAASYLVRTQFTDHRVTAELDGYTPIQRSSIAQYGILMGLGYEFGLFEHWQFGTTVHNALSDSFGLPSYAAMITIGYRYIHERRPPRCINGLSYQHDERCLPPDTDADGVYDPNDKCLTEPEDRDAFEDSDGCPDPDNDQDGLLDIEDQCPNEPEDRDGFQDEDGCPDPDNDKDGMLDGDDKCPNEAETKNGFDDEDGCPEPDDDNDDVPNANDRCPSEPEDHDNFQDEDGCPDPDNDQDGILDPKDLCPNEPENKNGLRDDDGCPDEILAVKTSKEIVITDEIHFVHGQVIPKKESRRILSAVTDILVGNPNLYVQIEGHTDDYGGANFNRYLSQARAQAVLDSIVRLAGKKADLGRRLTAIGFGKDKPIATNETKEGRADNRRVIFRIVSQ